MLDYLTVQASSANATILTVIYTYLICFVLSFLIAFTYEKTFRGLSYSRNYLQALILSPIVAATVMQAIGDSLGRGLGMIGALAIIRFRTNFKDPKDIIFMFASLAAGISCGVYGYSIAVTGTVFFCFTAFVLYISPFGEISRFDGLLRFNLENDSEDKAMLESMLKKHCKLFVLITLRDIAQGKRLDYAYHVKLKKSKGKADFIEQLKKLKTINGVSLMLQESTVEI